jgi:hypothetical protein
MDRRTRWIAGGAIALAVVGGGTGIAIASSGDDDRPLTGSVLDQATAAALDYTGGGAVVETDTGDGGAAYGVEVRLGDGHVVEVSLDENFNVVGESADDDGSNDQEESGND